MPLTPFSRPSFGHPPAIHLGWVILLCAAWVLFSLVGHDPWKPDEAYSFGLVYSILQNHDWVVPMLAGEPFMEKPPLYYLTAAGFARLFSGWLPLHDGARLASGFYMGLTLLFSALTARELWGKGYGRLTALILISCLGLLVRTHQLITDTALLAGFTIAFYGLALAPRRLVIGGVAIGMGTGIGFMSKGLLAPGTIAITALLLPLAFPAWRTRQYLASLAIAFTVALPWLTIWPYLLYQRAPQLFSEWLLVNNMGRFIGTAHLSDSHEPAYYLRMLPWFAWPTLPLALWTLWHQGWSAWRKPYIALPLTLFLVTLSILSAASEGHDVYALPLLPPLAVLGAAAVESLRRGAANALDWFSVMTFSLIAAVLWVGWYATLTGHPAELARKFDQLQPGYITHLDWPALFLALVLSLAWLTVVVRMERGALRAIVNSALGITLVWGLLATIWLPWLDAGKSYRAMFASMRQAMPLQYDCLASRNLGEPQRAMLHYFTGIISEREESYQPHCSLLLAQGSPQSIKPPGPNWRILWEGQRLGDNSEWFALFQKK
ncbi:MAG: glycosyltransferase family 39 protein [Sulfuricella sp.]|nr:glycosyltransferase family 39 protein [Sulfuricella sp.]